MKKIKFVILVFFLVMVFVFGRSVGASSRVFYENFEDGNADEFTFVGSHSNITVLNPKGNGSLHSLLVDVSITSDRGVAYVGWSENYTREFFIRLYVRINNDSCEPGWGGGGAKIIRILDEQSSPWDYESTSSCQDTGSYGHTEHHMVYLHGNNIVDKWASKVLNCGQWHKFEYYHKDDTDGTDGEIKLWWDDVLIEGGGLPYTGDTIYDNDPDSRPNFLGLPSNCGSQPPAPNHIQYDDIEIYTDANTGEPAIGSMENGTIEVITKPIITSVSGNLIDGNDITITGEGFGKKAIAGPIRFDQFEDNVSDGDRLNTGGFWELEEHTDAVYNASNQRTTLSRYNVRNKLVYGGNNGPFGKDVFNSKVGRKFISFWCYIGNVDVHPTDHWQLKLWRVLSGPDHGSYPTVAFQAWFNPDLTTYAHYYQTTGTDLGGIWGFSLPLNRWFYMQLEIQDSSGISVPDGTIIATALYGNGERYKVVKTGVKTRTSDYPDVFTWVKFGYFMTNNVSQGDTVTTYWDDIYIDYSWARVELGNAPSYDNCSHREIQKILTWNDDGSVISIEINQGSFPNGTAYLFVVDENGTVSDGYPITFSVGGHKADLNDDGVINMKELISFIARWKTGDGVSKTEVLDTREIWFVGGVY